MGLVVEGAEGLIASCATLLLSYDYLLSGSHVTAGLRGSTGRAESHLHSFIVLLCRSIVRLSYICSPSRYTITPSSIGFQTPLKRVHECENSRHLLNVPPPESDTEVSLHSKPPSLYEPFVRLSYLDLIPKVSVVCKSFALSANASLHHIVGRDSELACRFPCTTHACRDTLDDRPRTR